MTFTLAPWLINSSVTCTVGLLLIFCQFVNTSTPIFFSFLVVLLLLINESGQSVKCTVVAVGAGVVERHQPALVLGVQVGAVLQQHLHNAGAFVAGRQVDQRRLAAVAGKAVDVKRGQQRH